MLTTGLTYAQQSKADVARPKLVVGLVVDQMRWDYLYRYQKRYGDKGFKRLLKEGFSANNTYINYVPTVTGIGHTTVYTGSVPAIHGITGNDWITQATGKNMYCTQDDSVSSVGTSNNSGKMSPKNLLTSTVTDELRLATNFKSKVIGVAMKDRGSILPAGHFANAAYWYDGGTGKWITSTFYATQLPAWVNQFNDLKQPQKFLAGNWNTLYPINTYTESVEDNNPYERLTKGTTAPVFPVITSELVKESGFGLLTSTPFGNTFTLNFAQEAIINEKLGKNPSGATDFLTVSLSSPDYIGHQFAINSVEIEDNYLRLDKDLENFFKFLDQTVGAGEYTIFLTADHGAAHNPQFMLDRKANAGYFNSREVLKNLNAALAEKFNESKLVISLASYQAHLNHTLINSKKLDAELIKKAAVEFLSQVDGVAFAIEMDKALTSTIPARIRERIVNGYNPKRTGAIQIILEPQYFSGLPKGQGTSHGAWNPYDSHIPLVFMGWGVKPGNSNKVFNMTDIAPTIAALLNIQEPNGNIGSPIVEALKSQR
jgi:predicted AlkP superfamily pyrophosphatase or phosphodiesterase